jgi:hypothetical protein
MVTSFGEKNEDAGGLKKGAEMKGNSVLGARGRTE